MSNLETPYLNGHMYEFDLCWIVEKIMSFESELNQAIDLRTIHYADPIQWNITTQYAPNTVVVDAKTGTAYMSKIAVPSGILLTNTDYWVPIFNYQEIYNKIMTGVAYNNGDSEYAGKALLVNDLVWYGITLYRVVRAIDEGGKLIPGTNLIQTSIESLLVNYYGQDRTAQVLNDTLTVSGDLTVDAGDIAETSTNRTIKAKAYELDVDQGTFKTTNNSWPIQFPNKVVNLYDLVPGKYTTPEAYGAIGDGTADDTEAIKNAIASGLPIICGGIYKINQTINITSSIFMSGNSFFVIDRSVTDYGITIAKGKYIVNNTYVIHARGHDALNTVIGVGDVSRSHVTLRVFDAGTIGVNCNAWSDAGNNENIFDINVIGSYSGITSKGVIVNTRDSRYSEIYARNCKYGVSIENGALHADVVHVWMENALFSSLWTDSCAIHSDEYAFMQIKWLYQDSVRYGVNGKSLDGHIDYFEQNYTLTVTNPNNQVNVVDTGLCKLTVDEFVNDRSNDLIKYVIAGPNSTFGILRRAGGSFIRNDIQHSAPFTDINDAPAYGNFYCLYDIANLPEERNSYLYCTVIGSLKIQIVLREDMTTLKFRSKVINYGDQTWTAWSSITIG